LELQGQTLDDFSRVYEKQKPKKIHESQSQTLGNLSHMHERQRLKNSQKPQVPSPQQQQPPTAKRPQGSSGLSFPPSSNSLEPITQPMASTGEPSESTQLLEQSRGEPSESAQPSEQSHGIIPTLQNIVATANLNCRLDLKGIALHARNCEYNPRRFAAVIMRIREPKTTALIFASGKMVVTGARSESDSRLAARKYARIIMKLGFTVSFTDFKIQNVVASCDVKFPIRLEGLAFSHASFSSYEPELFPGLIYRMVKPKVVLLIFVSGKVVLTGARVREQIYQAFDTIYPVLTDFRKR